MKKNVDFYCLLLLFDFLSLKDDVNVPSKKNKGLPVSIKTWRKKLSFCWNPLKITDEKSMIRSRVSQRYGSEDPDPHLDPYQNVTGP